ncbi:spore coat protein [Clostridium luticellarii]|jgi:spore coat protein CotF|uniref:Coat F domain protein n=1 Tax=Clostridium luticellarii TaxID=1691940 RepID=A0A2T0BAD5_9CLOT|nr:spore coat protein [Clostridium luticellarii]MCI1944266.1 spore coat protein [Clostridium luticellarii]MCI1967762.1 spore coat protein [Clostridium luticellarii]MCI1994640.1 spore coat protein [Clostridium luticellarii]MCI2038863.1 spore coat protein [Clostridium luticellarii]PRR80802.1 Coat F domain protein [Clostridium luticellarii]
MSINLTNKERLLLEDQKNHETTCINKYTNYANQAQDSQLKQLFLNNASIEQEHLNSVNSLLSGTVPDLNNKQQSKSSFNANAASSSSKAGMSQVSDEDMCKDMLMTEKYISGTYDTSIFEFRDTNARDVLNHIQKEEQKHGESIYKYMESKGMYKAQ